MNKESTVLIITTTFINCKLSTKTNMDLNLSN